MTTAQLLRLAPQARESYLAAFAHTDVLERAGFPDHPLRFAHFLAQVCHETCGLTQLVENLQYSAERLRDVWPSHFPTVESAAPFARNPQKLANLIYGRRMGNIEPNDGWAFIGRGLIQLTGREHYARIGRALSLDLVGQPYLAASPDHMLAIAVTFWTLAGCAVHADADDLLRVTRAINGGTTGLEERRKWLAKAKAVLIPADEGVI